MHARCCSSIASKALVVFALLGSSIAGGRAGGDGLLEQPRLRPAAATAVAVVERRRRAFTSKKKSREQIQQQPARVGTFLQYVHDTGTHQY